MRKLTTILAVVLALASVFAGVARAEKGDIGGIGTGSTMYVKAAKR